MDVGNILQDKEEAIKRLQQVQRDLSDLLQRLPREWVEQAVAEAMDTTTVELEASRSSKPQLSSGSFPAKQPPRAAVLELMRHRPEGLTAAGIVSNLRDKIATTIEPKRIIEATLYRLVKERVIVRRPEDNFYRLVR